MASILKVDTITGVATAGSIAITGEGNSTTTNLQQGLAKSWASIVQGTSHTLNDSLNVGSITDAGSGETAVNFSNNMSNSNWCASVTCGNENNRRGTYNVNNTTRLKIEVYAVSSNTSAEDSDHVCGSAHGDLA
jgi:hypothetical protein